MPFHMKRILASSALMLGIFASLGFATPSLKIEPPAKKITTGQSATLKIRLQWPQSEDPYEINSIEPKLENLTLENLNQSQETGETVSQTFLYDFRPMKAGTAVIYPFEISFRKTEAEPWSPLFVPGHEIKVVSSLPLKVTLLGLVIAAGLLAAVFAVFKLRDLLRILETVRNTPPPDPKQRVYAKAEESIATFTSPNSKEKLTHWSNQLKIVVVTYYDVPSQAVSSTEVLLFLKAKGLPTGELNEITRLFEQLIEMQFSRQDIPAYDLGRIQKTLLQYVKGKIIIGNSNS